MKIFKLTIAKEIYMPILIIAISILLNKIFTSAIKKAFDPKKGHARFDARKIRTIRSLLCNFTKYGLLTIDILWILNIFGIKASTLAAGVGILSAVIGLAFQDILKDIISGISILFENQFAVGDYVKISGFEGNVVSLGLRTTRVQASTGEIKIVANRNISEVINYSMDKTLAVVDIPVSYESKIEKVEKVLMVTAATLKEKIPELTSDVQLLGVQELADSAVIFRLVGRCKPAEHFGVQRQMKKEFKNALDKNGIKIPYNQLEVHYEK